MKKSHENFYLFYFYHRHDKMGLEDHRNEYFFNRHQYLLKKLIDIQSLLP